MSTASSAMISFDLLVSQNTIFVLFILLFHLPSLTTSTKWHEYCSPPGPHIPWVSAKFLLNSQAVQDKFSELTSFLSDISKKTEGAAIYTYRNTVVGGLHLSLSITTQTETVYKFNHGFNEKGEGENPWTEHTVFRVASVSKALTVWEVIKLGIGWEEKVVRYLPELAEGRYGKEWAEVTVGGLAGYVGGATRDFEHDISQRPEHVPEALYKRDGLGNREEKGKGEGRKKGDFFGPEDIYDNILDIDGYIESIWHSYLPHFHPSEAWKMGFPPMEEVEEKRCLFNCTRDDVLRTLSDHPLVYPAFTTPAYSNVGFTLLGLVLERKSGLLFDALMQRDMYGPLGMKDTFHKLPWDHRLKREGWGAHPFWGANDTWHETREIWGDWGVPGGGIFTSAHDLCIFLRTILAAFPFSTDPGSYPNKYDVLPKAKVREWLTPTAFTGGKTMLGRPWEIKRKGYPDVHGDRPVTLFTKAGGGTGYNAGIVILPEYGIGISVLIAGDGGTFNHHYRSYSYHWNPIVKLLLGQKGLLKTIEQAAYEQAEQEYIGEYLFSSSILDGDDGTHIPTGRSRIQRGPIYSGIEIIRDHGPGLRIKKWTSNGTDFLESLVNVKMQMASRKVKDVVAVARLYPIGNVRERGRDRWAEDWRLWFDWEYENLKDEKEKTKKKQEEEYVSPYEQAKMDYELKQPKQKARVQMPPPRPPPSSRPIQQRPIEYYEPRVWPDVLPGDPQDRVIPPIEQQDDQPTLEDEGNEDEVEGGKKGWAKPTKSSATTSNSEPGARTLSNKPRPPWWRAKYDNVDSLNKYQRRKKLTFDDLAEAAEGDGEPLEPKQGGGKKDKFVQYTYKVAESHGMASDGYAEGVEMEDYADNNPGERWFGKFKNEQGTMGWDDDDDDDDFFVPDYPPHSQPIRFSEWDADTMFSQSPPHINDYVDDDFYADTHDVGRTTHLDPQTADSSWDYYVALYEEKRDEEQRIARNKGKKKWPCSDYNGVEIQSWAGWSLGLVRFIREGSDRAVVGMEVPALKVRLGKVGVKSRRPWRDVFYRDEPIQETRDSEGIRKVRVNIRPTTARGAGQVWRVRGREDQS